MTKNTLSLILVTVVVTTFIFAGIFDILHYFIIKLILISCLGYLGINVSIILFKSSLIKNRPKEELQDDYNKHY